MKAGALVNQGGAVVASGDSTLAVTVDGKLDNSAGGMLAAGGDLTLKSASWKTVKAQSSKRAAAARWLSPRANWTALVAPLVSKGGA